jgi:hypothetical protein
MMRNELTEWFIVRYSLAPPVRRHFAGKPSALRSSAAVITFT